MYSIPLDTVHVNVKPSPFKHIQYRGNSFKSFKNFCSLRDDTMSSGKYWV